MAEENQFFRPVKDFCQRTVVTCAPGDALVDVVRVMREKNISSVVVVEGGELTARVPREQQVKAGQKVTFRAEAKHLYLFDAGTGATLR